VNEPPVATWPPVLAPPMPGERMTSSRRVLEPSERIAEVLFGLIMVLTFTGSLSVAEADRAEVRTMLIGALGCNAVWGIIDGVLYLMGCLAERSRGLTIFRAVRRAADPQQAQRLIADALPPVVASLLQPAELETLRLRLMHLPDPPRTHLGRDDWLGAVGVFLLVFLSTFPVALPFVFMQQVGPALRLSNGIALLMLFLCGYAYGKCVERRPWLTGIAMVVLGSVLVGLTIALGG
jgi:hypothetical protein